MQDFGLVADDNPVLGQIDRAATRYGVDRNLAHVVAQMESSYNPNAVSHVGAQGVMQLMPATANSLGVRHPFDSSENIDGGVRYLKFLLEKFNGDLDLSLAAYNAGENLVERLGRIPAIPETANYVRRVRAIYKKKSTPVAVPSGSPAMTAVSAKAPSSKIYKTVDSRGVVHFSNIEPSN